MWLLWLRYYRGRILYLYVCQKDIVGANKSWLGAK